MAKQHTSTKPSPNLLFDRRFGWINFVLAGITSSLTVIFIYCTWSDSWVVATEIYVVGSNFRRDRGLFRECTYVGAIMDCENPYPNLVMTSKPFYYLAGQFSMPLVIILEFVSTFVYIQGHPCTKNTLINKDQRSSLFQGGQKCQWHCQCLYQCQCFSVPVPRQRQNFTLKRH